MTEAFGILLAFVLLFVAVDRIEVVRPEPPAANHRPRQYRTSPIVPQPPPPPPQEQFFIPHMIDQPEVAGEMYQCSKCRKFFTGGMKAVCETGWRDKSPEPTQGAEA